jgi:Flp pilus assembly protein TadD
MKRLIVLAIACQLKRLWQHAAVLGRRDVVVGSAFALSAFAMAMAVALLGPRVSLLGPSWASRAASALCVGGGAFVAYALGRRWNLPPRDAVLAALPWVLSSAVVDLVAASDGWRVGVSSVVLMACLALPASGWASWAAEAATIVTLAVGWALAPAAVLAARRFVEPTGSRRRLIALTLALIAGALAAIRGGASRWLELDGIAWLPAAMLRLLVAWWPSALHVWMAVGQGNQSDTWIPPGWGLLVAASWAAWRWRGQAIPALSVLAPILSALAIPLAVGAVVPGAATVLIAAATTVSAVALLGERRGVAARALVLVLVVAPLAQVGRRMAAYGTDEALVADAAVGAPRDGRADVAWARTLSTGQSDTVLARCSSRNAPLCSREIGMRAIARGDAGTAAQAFLRASETIDDDPQIWFGLGAALHLGGYEREARDALARGFLYRDAAWARILYGSLLLTAAQPRQAELNYKRALELDPKSWEALRGLGLVAQADGDVARARRVFTQALAKAPDSAELHRDLARACIRLGAYAEALENVDIAVRLRPGDVELANEASALRERLGVPARNPN